MFIQLNDDDTFTVFSSSDLKENTKLIDLGGMYWPKIFDTEHKIFREGVIFEKKHLDNVKQMIDEYYNQDIDSVSTENDLQLEDVYDLLQEMIDRVIRLEKHVYGDADSEE